MSISQPVPLSQRKPKQPAGPWHRKVGGLHVLKVKGSFREMGRQHGQLLREAIPLGPLPYYRTYIERILGSRGPALSTRLVWPLLQRVLGRRVEAKMLPFAEQTLRGLAEGADIPYADVLAACTMPDSLVWVASRMMGLKRIKPAFDHRLALGLGCSTAIAWNDATEDGRLLHARNLDYHGVGVWPRTAAVIFHEPDEGQNFVSVGAAGVTMGGITAMNEAGLTLTVHQHMFTDQAAFGGTPIGEVGDIIMREATTLDEAEAILRQHRPIGCWTYLVTDGHTREVLCWEESPKRHVAMRSHPDDSTFAYSNIYFDAELGATEMNLYGSYWRHNQGRLERVREMLAAGNGMLDATGMASILACPGTTSCRIHRSIAMLMTVGSVVFRPEDGAFWVSTGEAPTSRNTFIAFDLQKESEAPEHGNLTGHQPDDSPDVTAFNRYRQAYLAYFDEEDLGKSRQLMEQVLASAPKQSLFHLVTGLLALKDNDVERAVTAFDTALSIGHPDEQRLAGFHVWKARAADLLSQHDEAEHHYRAALGRRMDPPMERAAKRGLKHPYTTGRAKGFHVDFTFADVVAP